MQRLVGTRELRELRLGPAQLYGADAAETEGVEPGFLSRVMRNFRDLTF